MKKYIVALIVLSIFGFGTFYAQAFDNTDCVTSEPSITVLSPNGGEVYTMGQNVTIEWHTCNAQAGQTVSLSIGQEVSAGAFYPLVSFYPYQIANDGTETVTLNGSSTNGNWPFTPGTNYKISAVLNPLPTNTQETPYVQDQSDNSFTISSAPTSCVPGTVAGTLTSALDPKSPADMSVLAGTNNVEILQIDLSNVSDQNVCLNGIQLGSSSELNNFISNTKVVDKSTGLQVGQIVNSFSNNGSYYYSWVTLNPSLSIQANAEKIFGVVSDFPFTAKQGDFKIGFWGLNFDVPGAHSLPQVVSGNIITVNSNTCPAGCTCNGEATTCPVVDGGCLSGYKYNPNTGKLCPNVLPTDGCLSGYKYNPITGQKCLIATKTCSSSSELGCSVPSASIQRTLKIGATGTDVKTLQSFLGVTADGSFGPMTKAKVAEWQKVNGLTQDGIFGPASLQKASLTQ